MTVSSVYAGTAALGAVSPSRQEFRERGAGASGDPVARRTAGRRRDPVGLYRKLAADRAGHVPAGVGGERAVLVALVVRGGALRGGADRGGGEATWLGTPPVGLVSGGDPLVALRHAIEELRTEPLAGLPR